MQARFSREGLCDFGRPGIRRADHRAILVDHLYLFCWHNGWEITKRRLRDFTYRELIGMMNRLARGQGSWLFDRLLLEQGYGATRHGLPFGPPPAQQRLVFDTDSAPHRPIATSRRSA